MDFFEAMEKMRKGEVVRLKSWPKEKFIGVKEEEVKVFGKRRVKYTVIDSNELDLPPCIPFSVLVSSEWCLVEQD